MESLRLLDGLLAAGNELVVAAAAQAVLHAPEHAAIERNGDPLGQDADRFRVAAGKTLLLRATGTGLFSTLEAVLSDTPACSGKSRIVTSRRHRWVAGRVKAVSNSARKGS
jgi:hypothetical protein